MMQHVICTKVKGEVGQDFTGPFDTYDEAMDVFVTMGPASAYEHKYIGELFTPEERVRIFQETRASGNSGLEGRDDG